MFATAHKHRCEGVSASRRGAGPDANMSEQTPHHHTQPHSIDPDPTDLVAGDPPVPPTVSRTARTPGDAGPRRAAHTPGSALDAAWSIDQIRALGVVTDLRTAARILGLSANTAYALAQRDAFPVPVLRAGRQYRVSVQAILTALDAPPASAPPPAPGGGQTPHRAP